MKPYLPRETKAMIQEMKERPKRSVSSKLIKKLLFGD
jgi:hypothetical protein